MAKVLIVFTMTALLTIYDDTELDPLLPGTRRLVELHRQLEMPASFGIVTAPLEQDSRLLQAYIEVLGDAVSEGLVEVVPHSHTHPMFCDHKTMGPGITQEVAAFEIGRSRELVAQWFGHLSRSFRATNGYYGGWSGRPELLSLVAENGFTTLSSFSMGPDDTVPGALTQPFFYAEDGFPDLLEVPGNDWHDNVLQGWPYLPAAWPPCVPSGLPARPPRTPEEKFEIYRPNMEWAVAHGLDSYAPPLHTWATKRFEPEATWLEMLLHHARSLGMEVMTLTQFADAWRSRNPPGDKAPTVSQRYREVEAVQNMMCQ